jgi:2-dehydro-3-deoxygluconokinase
VELVTPRLVLFGEGMVEQRADGTVGYGGDVVNTAVYLARLGARPALMTAVGDDAESAALVAAWAAEGIDVAQVLRDPARRVGRYAVRLGADGERSFTYDRAESAARAFFRQPGAEAALAWAADAGLVYVSGITLAIFSAGERRRLADLAAQVRERGGAVAFDPNLRPALWPSILDAQAAILAFSRQIDIALPSLEDHAALFGPASAEVAARVWQATGATEVVVKAGAAGAFVLAGDQHALAPAETAARVIDTTGAGDAFNAAYLAARRLHGATIGAAARAGAALAAEVVAWPGAIAPRPVGVGA